MSTATPDPEETLPLDTTDEPTTVPPVDGPTGQMPASPGAAGTTPAEAGASSPAPSAHRPATTSARPPVPPEAPARGVRVGQLVWGGLVLLLGVFLIVLALVQDLDMPLTLIGLLGMLGIGLILAAIASGMKQRH